MLGARAGLGARGGGIKGEPATVRVLGELESAALDAYQNHLKSFSKSR